jgi:hypothetical protein
VIAADVVTTDAVCGVFEPNEDFDMAVPLWEALERPDLAICPANDRDTFYIEVSPDQNYILSARGLTDSGQADLSLTTYRPDGRVYSATSGINPGVAFSGEHESFFYVQVTGLYGQDLIPYMLTLREY